jgi:hypothetical protein
MPLQSIGAARLMRKAFGGTLSPPFDSISYLTSAPVLVQSV